MAKRPDRPKPGGGSASPGTGSEGWLVVAAAEKSTAGVRSTVKPAVRAKTARSITTVAPSSPASTVDGRRAAHSTSTTPAATSSGGTT